jgi:hypothetical protein
MHLSSSYADCSLDQPKHNLFKKKMTKGWGHGSSGKASA